MDDFGDSGFFIFRTPLLPIDQLLCWSSSLEASTVLEVSAEIDDGTLATDKALLRERLKTILSRPEIREALFVASPDLDDSLQFWLKDPESEKGRRVERTLVRYVARMCARPTPFGLFGGTSIGKIGEFTRLNLESCEAYQRHTRLDMDYLYAVREALSADKDLRKRFLYSVNTSLFRVAGRIRYIESRLKEKIRSHHLIAVEESEELLTVLTACEGATSVEILSASLTTDEISAEEADAYITELIDSEILVPVIPLLITGVEPVEPLIRHLKQYEQTRSQADALEEAVAKMSDLDQRGIGSSTEAYKSIAENLKTLPAKVELPRLFQVDMMKPVEEALLAKNLVEEVRRGVEILRKLAPPMRELSALKRFRERFVERYESQPVLLFEALDEEIGIGFGLGKEPSPLLRDLFFGRETETEEKHPVREEFLLRKWSEAIQKGVHEIQLRQEDLSLENQEDNTPLPDAICIVLSLLANSQKDIQKGDYRILINSAYGPSGASLMGRFCHASKELTRFVRAHLKSEEALHPDAIFAEIVHLPEGRVGNVLCRPVLRDYEIVYLGDSGAPAEFQIPVSDLLVSVSGSRVVLWSVRLGREVIPRMTNAHNFSRSSHGVYRFLCTLQSQHTAGVFWDWGALRNAPFLPRVRFGRLIFSPAQWQLNRSELERLTKSEGVQLFRNVQHLRKERRLPRWIGVVDNDNVLPVDLDNVLMVETFAQLVKNRQNLLLKELFFDQQCASGPEGKFTNEVILPLVREIPKSSNAIPRSSYTLTKTDSNIIREFAPGSEWLYCKIYTGTASVDLILKILAPLIHEMMDSEIVNHWFFIRYGDPEWHLRVRFMGNPQKLQRILMPALQANLEPLLHDRRVWRIQFDTYRREVERYGGPDAIAIAEQIFHVDSKAVLEILEMLESGDEGMIERWHLALRGLDMLMNDFAFESSDKRKKVREILSSYQKEFRVQSVIKRRLGEKLRSERHEIEAVLQLKAESDHPLSPGVHVLKERSAQLRPLIAELEDLENQGRLTSSVNDMVGSYLHMFVNRLVRSEGREHELVLYDFLAHLYESQSFRQRK